MAQDKVIQLSVKVNADTGQLEVLGAKFKGTAAAAKEAQGSFAALGKEAGQLLSTYLPFATGAGIIAFFSNAVVKANEHAESMRRLQGNVEAAGISFEQNKQKIAEWSEAVQAATRFDNDEAISSLERFVRATGNLTQAMRASKLAMDISVSTGKSLEDSQRILIDLVAGNERGLKLANKELGAFTGGARSAQSALDNLQRTLGGAAEKERSFQKDISQTKAAFDDFSRTIGESLGPAVAFIVKQSTNLLRVFESLGSAIAGTGAVMFETLKGMGAAMSAAVGLHFSRVKVIALDTAKAVKEVYEKTSEDLDHIWGKQTETQIQEALKAGEGRLVATVQSQEQVNDRLTELEAELNQRLAAIGDDTFQKKRAIAAQEIAVEKAKIDKEFKDEVDKNGRIIKVNQDRVKLLGKLNEIELKQTQQLNKEEVRAKQVAALQVADLAVQTLAVLNSLGDSHNRSAVLRAKAILALEKAIAIAKAIAAAQSGGPFAPAIAAASIALIGAQFAQQYKAIDEASKTSSADVGGGGAGNFSAPSAASDTTSPAAAAKAGPASSAGGSGGGGAGFNGNITVSIQLNVGSLDLTNSDAMFRQMVEAAKSGTMDALAKMLGVRLIEQINGAGQLSMVRGGD